MFFPKLSRSCEKKYFNSKKKFYADYKMNHKKVSEDCNHRCVYCDITVEESGGDEMQLDHFRPRKHFANLASHPHNLYLSCPKCNVLKSSDWPCPKNTGSASFIGPVGYLDRFQHNANDYLEVDKDGRISHLGGPANYMIKKMYLNRPSRVNVRLKRIFAEKKDQMLKSLHVLVTQTINDGTLSKQQKEEKGIIIDSILSKIVQI